MSIGLFSSILVKMSSVFLNAKDAKCFMFFGVLGCKNIRALMSNVFMYDSVHIPILHLMTLLYHHYTLFINTMIIHFISNHQLVKLSLAPLNFFLCLVHHMESPSNSNFTNFTTTEYLLNTLQVRHM